MKTRKRVSLSEKEESGGVDRSPNLRKRLRTECASKEWSDDSGDSDSETVEEDESDSKELNSEDCIESEGRWFSLSAFEQFGGKGASKKWRCTIVYNNYPLQHWIDCGDLNPSRRHRSAALEMPHRESNHPKDSDENSNHEEEGEPGEDQKEEKINRTHIESITLKRKPMLILHKLEHLQGDFHLLLNNVVLPQKGDSVLKEEQTVTTEDKRLGAEEGSEPQEHTHDPDGDSAPKGNETEEKINLGTEKNSEDAKNENNEDNLEEANSHEGDWNDEVTEATSELIENIVLTLENEEPEEEVKSRLDTEESSEPQEETLAQDASSENDESMLQVPSPNAKIIENIQEEAESGAAECPTTQPSHKEVTSDYVNVTAPQLLTDSSPSTLMLDEAATAQTSAELDVMDLEQLKREKLKMQIKVLKLQEAYYSLQLKMNQ